MNGKGGRPWAFAFCAAEFRSRANICLKKCLYYAAECGTIIYFKKRRGEGERMSVHEGHRQRKKEQFREHGLDAFADHEALELLLYYAIPRQDTNPIAHRLIERFGSLEGVFSAPAYELQKVEGVGENAATLIRLLFPLCRRVRTSGGRHEVIFNTRENIGAYFIELFLGERREVFYEACLDAKGKLLACYRLAEGSPDQVTVNMRRVVENALNANASLVVLSHNHPSGVALPSKEDNQTTLQIKRALADIGVQLVDHVIVADGDFVCLRDNGLLD